MNFHIYGERIIFSCRSQVVQSIETCFQLHHPECEWGIHFWVERWVRVFATDWFSRVTLSKHGNCTNEGWLNLHQIPKALQQHPVTTIQYEPLDLIPSEFWSFLSLKNTDIATGCFHSSRPILNDISWWPICLPSNRNERWMHGGVLGRNVIEKPSLRGCLLIIWLSVGGLPSGRHNNPRVTSTKRPIQAAYKRLPWTHSVSRAFQMSSGRSRYTPHKKPEDERAPIGPWL